MKNITISAIALTIGFLLGAIFLKIIGLNHISQTISGNIMGCWTLWFVTKK